MVTHVLCKALRSVPSASMCVSAYVYMYYMCVHVYNCIINTATYDCENCSFYLYTIAIVKNFQPTETQINK